MIKNKLIPDWNLETFKIPRGYRGRNIVIVLLWDFVNYIIFSSKLC